MEKGTAGYIDAYKKRYGRMALLFFVVIAVMVVGIYLTLGTVRHIAVVAPILLALPFGKVFTLWVVVAKFHSIGTDERERIEETLSDRKNIRVLYDMALSSYESVSYAPCIVVEQGNVYMLWGGAAQNEYTEEHQREYVRGIVNKADTSLEVVTVHSVEELIQKCSEVPESEEDVEPLCDRIRQRLLDVCV